MIDYINKDLEILKNFISTPWVTREQAQKALDRIVHELKCSYFVCPDCGYKVTSQEFFYHDEDE